MKAVQTFCVILIAAIVTIVWGDVALVKVYAYNKALDAAQMARGAIVDAKERKAEAWCKDLHHNPSPSLTKVCMEIHLKNN